MRHFLTGLCTFGALISGPTPLMAQTQHGPGDKNPVDPLYRGLPPPPGEMQQLYDQFDQGQRAISGEDDPHRLAVPVSRSVTVRLVPGAQINIIRIAQDYPSSITFLDATGQPWPIAWDVTTNKLTGCGQDGRQAGSGHGPSVRAVGINACVPEAGSNVLQLTPISRYAHGGVLISLKGAPKPISFMFVAGTGSYDADMTARILDRGPNARDIPTATDDAPDNNDPTLANIMDGVPPAEAVPLRVGGVSPDTLRAWRFHDALYVRSAYPVLSPASTGHRTEYQFTAYRLPVTPRLELAGPSGIVAVDLSEDTP